MASVGERVSVLYVDDGRVIEEPVRTLEERSERMQVTREGSAQDGLERIRADDVDCVVSAYELDGMDGISFLRRVRAYRESLPFVLCTPNGDETVASDAISAGVTEYVRDEPGADTAAVLVETIERVAKAGRERVDESRRMLSTLLSNLPGMVYRCRNEPGWPMAFVSDGCRDLTGYAPEALERGDVSWGSDVVHDEDEGRLWDAVQDALEASDPFELRYRIVTKAGEVRWVWEQGRGVYEDGDLAALEGFITDITDRKRAQRRRRQYETIVESMDDGAFILDADGRFEFVNTALVENLDTTREDLLGSSCELFAAKTEDVTTDAFRRTLAAFRRGDRSQFRTEFDLAFPGGTDRTVNVQLSRLTADGEFDGVVGVARDTTERTERERELERYETIIQAVGDPVYALDEQGHITFGNDALHAATGYDREELLGEHVSAIMREVDIERARDLIRDLLRSDERTNATFEMSLFPETGDPVPCENHMALLPFDDDGDFRGTAGIVRDITERKQREERLEQFAGVVSHDLRNPLDVINTRSRLASETGDLDHLDAVRRAVDRMDDRIGDLLTLARQGNVVGDTEPVDVDTVARTAWEHVDTTGAAFEQTPIGTVQADRDRLCELFENLFRNAVEHGSTSPRSQAPEDAVEHGSTSPPSQTQQDAAGTSSGEPSVADAPEDAVEHGTGAPTVRVGPLPDDDASNGTPARPCGFYVADDGPGIPPADRERVFDHGVSNSEAGTGIGLAIVANVAEAHDWSVTVTESWAGGARFEVRVDDRRG